MIVASPHCNLQRRQCNMRSAYFCTVALEEAQNAVSRLGNSALLELFFMF